MVKTKVIAGFILTLAIVGGCGTSYSWSVINADASRTGVKPAKADNTEQALGYVVDGTYYAPSGEVYSQGATPQLASILIKAQPQMAPLKEVIAYAPKSMSSSYPQSELSNFTVDCIMSTTQKLTGKKVDVGIMNFGGIRCSIPQGDVLLDDIVSMFPFKNYLVYVAMEGDDLRELFEKMASSKMQAVGGVEVVIKDDKLESLKVGGEEFDDDKIYGVASIDFLLRGGDNLNLADEAQDIIYTGVLLKDCILEKIYELSAAGMPLEYHLDDRIVIE